MTLVTDFVGWLASDHATPHARLAGGARERGQAGRSAIPAAPPRKPQAFRPSGGGAVPKSAAAVVPMEAQREPRILQARRVVGTSVFDASGARAGRIADLSIDKQTGRVVYALIGIEGGLGFLKRLYPAPWDLLRYDAAKGGYVTPVDGDDLADGPALTPSELQSLGAGDDAWRERLAIYYSPYFTVPFI